MGLLLDVLVFTCTVALEAVGEVNNVYTAWRQAVGSWRIQPPYPNRLTGLLGLANPYMAMMNLAAPFALVFFFKIRSFVGRLGVVFGWRSTHRPFRFPPHAAAYLGWRHGWAQALAASFSNTRASKASTLQLLGHARTRAGFSSLG